jgi:hypothetical protein
LGVPRKASLRIDGYLISQFPPAKLLIPREEAEAKIKGQIEEACRILDSAQGVSSLSRERHLENNEAAREKWAKFTTHLLETLFTDGSIANEFGESWLQYSSGLDKFKQLIAWMRRKIVRLESIAQRLPLFPLADTPAKVTTDPAPSTQQSMDIFIVHGHENAAKEEAARFIEKLGLRAIVLHELSDRGRTIIEKFEDHSNVGFAVVLLTPDDVGHPKDEPAKAKPRARQNVVLELGFFLGKLNRPRVCALLKGDIEIPSDYVGVLYMAMDDGGA